MSGSSPGQWSIFRIRSKLPMWRSNSGSAQYSGERPKSPRGTLSSAAPRARVVIGWPPWAGGAPGSGTWRGPAATAGMNFRPAPPVANPAAAASSSVPTTPTAVSLRASAGGARRLRAAVRRRMAVAKVSDRLGARARSSKTKEAGDVLAALKTLVQGEDLRILLDRQRERPVDHVRLRFGRAAVERTGAGVVAGAPAQWAAPAWTLQAPSDQKRPHAALVERRERGLQATDPPRVELRQGGASRRLVCRAQQRLHPPAHLGDRGLVGVDVEASDNPLAHLAIEPAEDLPIDPLPGADRDALITSLPRPLAQQLHRATHMGELVLWKRRVGPLRCPHAMRGSTAKLVSETLHLLQPLAPALQQPGVIAV